MIKISKRKKSIIPLIFIFLIIVTWHPATYAFDAFKCADSKWNCENVCNTRYKTCDSNCEDKKNDDASRCYDDACGGGETEYCDNNEEWDDLDDCINDTERNYGDCNDTCYNNSLSCDEICQTNYNNCNSTSPISSSNPNPTTSSSSSSSSSPASSTASSSSSVPNITANIHFSKGSAIIEEKVIITVTLQNSDGYEVKDVSCVLSLITNTTNKTPTEIHDWGDRIKIPANMGYRELTYEYTTQYIGSIPFEANVYLSGSSKPMTTISGILKVENTPLTTSIANPRINASLNFSKNPVIVGETITITVNLENKEDLLIDNISCVLYRFTTTGMRTLEHSWGDTLSIPKNGTKALTYEYKTEFIGKEESSNEFELDVNYFNTDIIDVTGYLDVTDIPIPAKPSDTSNLDIDASLEFSEDSVTVDNDVSIKIIITSNNSDIVTNISCRLYLITNTDSKLPSLIHDWGDDISISNSRQLFYNYQTEFTGENEFEAEIRYFDKILKTKTIKKSLKVEKINENPIDISIESLSSSSSAISIEEDVTLSIGLVNWETTQVSYSLIITAIQSQNGDIYKWRYNNNILPVSIGIQPVEHSITLPFPDNYTITATLVWDDNDGDEKNMTYNRPVTIRVDPASDFLGIDVSIEDITISSANGLPVYAGEQNTIQVRLKKWEAGTVNYIIGIQVNGFPCKGFTFGSIEDIDGEEKIIECEFLPTDTGIYNITAICYYGTMDVEQVKTIELRVFENIISEPTAPDITYDDPPLSNSTYSSYLGDFAPSFVGYEPGHIWFTAYLSQEIKNEISTDYSLPASLTLTLEYNDFNTDKNFSESNWTDIRIEEITPASNSESDYLRFDATTYFPYLIKVTNENNNSSLIKKNSDYSDYYWQTGQDIYFRLKVEFNRRRETSSIVKIKFPEPPEPILDDKLIVETVASGLSNLTEEEEKKIVGKLQVRWKYDKDYEEEEIDEAITSASGFVIFTNLYDSEGAPAYLCYRQKDLDKIKNRDKNGYGVLKYYPYPKNKNEFLSIESIDKFQERYYSTHYETKPLSEITKTAADIRKEKYYVVAFKDISTSLPTNFWLGRFEEKWIPYTLGYRDSTLDEFIPYQNDDGAPVTSYVSSIIRSPELIYGQGTAPTYPPEVNNCYIELPPKAHSYKISWDYPKDTQDLITNGKLKFYTYVCKKTKNSSGKWTEWRLFSEGSEARKELSEVSTAPCNNNNSKIRVTAYVTLKDEELANSGFILTNKEMGFSIFAMNTATSLCSKDKPVLKNETGYDYLDAIDASIASGTYKGAHPVKLFNAHEGPNAGELTLEWEPGFWDIQNDPSNQDRDYEYLLTYYQVSDSISTVAQENPELLIGNIDSPPWEKITVPGSSTTAPKTFYRAVINFLSKTGLTPDTNNRYKFGLYSKPKNPDLARSVSVLDDKHQLRFRPANEYPSSPIIKRITSVIKNELKGVMLEFNSNSNYLEIKNRGEGYYPDPFEKNYGLFVIREYNSSPESAAEYTPKEYLFRPKVLKESKDSYKFFLPGNGAGNYVYKIWEVYNDYDDYLVKFPTGKNNPVCDWIYGVWSEGSETSAAISTDYPDKAAPEIVEVYGEGSGGNKKIHLQWNEVAGVSNYKVYISTGMDSNKKWKVYPEKGTLTQTGLLIDLSTESANDYNVIAAAYYPNGVESLSETREVHFTTVCGSVSLLKAQLGPRPGEVTLAWEVEDNENIIDGFRIYVNKRGDTREEVVVVKDKTARCYIVEGLSTTTGVTYSFEVSGIFSAIEGKRSTRLQVQIQGGIDGLWHGTDVDFVNEVCGCPNIIGQSVTYIQSGEAPEPPAPKNLNIMHGDRGGEAIITWTSALPDGEYQDGFGFMLYYAQGERSTNWNKYFIPYKGAGSSTDKDILTLKDNLLPDSNFNRITDEYTFKTTIGGLVPASKYRFKIQSYYAINTNGSISLSYNPTSCVSPPFLILNGPSGQISSDLKITGMYLEDFELAFSKLEWDYSDPDDREVDFIIRINIEGKENLFPDFDSGQLLTNRKIVFNAEQGKYYLHCESLLNIDLSMYLGKINTIDLNSGGTNDLDVSVIPYYHFRDSLGKKYIVTSPKGQTTTAQIYYLDFNNDGYKDTQMKLSSSPANKIELMDVFNPENRKEIDLGDSNFNYLGAFDLNTKDFTDIDPRVSQGQELLFKKPDNTLKILMVVNNNDSFEVEERTKSITELAAITNNNPFIPQKAYYLYGEDKDTIEAEWNYIFSHLLRIDDKLYALSPTAIYADISGNNYQLVQCGYKIYGYELLYKNNSLFINETPLEDLIVYLNDFDYGRDISNNVPLLTDNQKYDPDNLAEIPSITPKAEETVVNNGLVELIADVSDEVILGNEDPANGGAIGRGEKMVVNLPSTPISAFIDNGVPSLASDSPDSSTIEGINGEIIKLDQGKLPSFDFYNDKILPEIKITPIEDGGEYFISDPTPELKIRIEITDNLGINSQRTVITLNGHPLFFIPIRITRGFSYELSITNQAFYNLTVQGYDFQGNQKNKGLNFTISFSHEWEVSEGDSIQDAIDKANDNDVIIVHPGTYYEKIRFWDKDKCITLTSDDPDNPSIVSKTILDGNGENGTIVSFSEGQESTIEGFTIINGGGIYCYSESKPLIKLCIISDNKTESPGGGISCSNCGMTMQDCIIKDNISRQKGGGILIDGHYPDYDYPVELDNCLIINNKGTLGGGIYANNTSLRITNCTITDNNNTSSTNYGNGIYFKFSQTDKSPKTDIRYCIIWGNGSGSGWSKNIWITQTDKVKISYSDIGDIGKMNYEDDGTNINRNPYFESGSLGDYYENANDYYLTYTGLSKSRCIDRVKDIQAVDEEMDHLTTSIVEGSFDEGLLDLGYHYPQPPKPKSDCVRGDVNCDGSITPADALEVFQVYIGNEPYQEGIDYDVNQDGSISPSDALCIFQNYLGQPSCLDSELESE
ncbi:MAG: dockerin type I domain-containing protein [bacterium]